MDFRPDGVWRCRMRGPAGEDTCGKAIYHEIVAPERIVYTDVFVDAAGNVIDSTPDMLITLTLADENGQTKLTNRAQFASG